MKQADQNSSVAFGTSRSETIQRGESEEKDSARQKVFPLSGEFSVVFNFFFSSFLFSRTFFFAREKKRNMDDGKKKKKKQLSGAQKRKEK